MTPSSSSGPPRAGERECLEHQTSSKDIIMEASFQAAWQQILLHPRVCAMNMLKSEQFLVINQQNDHTACSIYPVLGTTSWRSGKKTCTQKHCQMRMCTQIWTHLPLNGNKKIANFIFWHISCLVTGLISSSLPITIYQLTYFCFMKAW